MVIAQNRQEREEAKYRKREGREDLCSTKTQRTEAYRERNGLSGQSQSPDLSLIENLWLKKKDKPLVTLHVLKLVCGTLVVVTLSASNTEGGDTCQSIHTI